jgi:hypothetical protein
MFGYSGFGQAPEKRAIPARVLDSYRDLPIEARRACLAAVRAGQYPNAIPCYDEVRRTGAPPILDAPLTAEATPEDRTKLYVGIGIAVVVVGVGAYLITR